ncbi:MAG: hypothetical protein WC004_01320 [Candidatus Absconditabacterales bacterium]
MNNIKKVFTSIVLGLGLRGGIVFADTGCLSGSSCTILTSWTFYVESGALCIGSEGSFAFGAHTVSASSQVITGTFTEYFRVDDLKLAYSGYYTTVQMSGHLIGTGGEAISGSNVYMKTPSLNPDFLDGYTLSGVTIHTGMSSFQSLDTARQLILRNPGTVTGSIGSYGTIPEMQLILPPYQAVGTYNGTLVFTLYENA